MRTARDLIRTASQQGLDAAQIVDKLQSEMGVTASVEQVEAALAGRRLPSEVRTPIEPSRSPSAIAAQLELRKAGLMQAAERSGAAKAEDEPVIVRRIRGDAEEAAQAAPAPQENDAPAESPHV